MTESEWVRISIWRRGTFPGFKRWASHAASGQGGGHWPPRFSPPLQFESLPIAICALCFLKFCKYFCCFASPYSWYELPIPVECQRNLILPARTRFGGFGHSTEYLVPDKFFSQGFPTITCRSDHLDHLMHSLIPDFSGHRRVYRSAEHLGDMKFGTSHFGLVQTWLNIAKHDETLLDEGIANSLQSVCCFFGTHVDLRPQCVGFGSKLKSRMRHGSKPSERLLAVWKQLISNPPNWCRSWAMLSLLNLL